MRSSKIYHQGDKKEIEQVIDETNRDIFIVTANELKEKRKIIENTVMNKLR